MLSNIAVRSVTEIVKTYALEGQGSTFSSTDTGVVPLGEEAPGSVAYIASSAEDQQFARLSLLPQKLCEFMNIDIEKAGLIIATVPNAKLGYMGGYMGKPVSRMGDFSLPKRGHKAAYPQW